jgi:hypothetical protein
MDNTKLPAYPHTIYERVGDDKFVATTDVNNPGFTKLELASLMMAAAIATNRKSIHYKSTATSAVMLAKAVLEEANK